MNNFVKNQSQQIIIPGDDFAFASLFAGNFSLLLSLVIGFIAIFIIFRSAKKMGGGLFGSVLNYIGVGVTLIVFGTMATTADPWFSGLGFNMISTACFALGYIFVVVGANKLLKGIMSN
jgi:hypothetical protein